MMLHSTYLGSGKLELAMMSFSTSVDLSYKVGKNMNASKQASLKKHIYIVNIMDSISEYISVC